MPAALSTVWAHGAPWVQGLPQWKVLLPRQVAEAVSFRLCHGRRGLLPPFNRTKQHATPCCDLSLLLMQLTSDMNPRGAGCVRLKSPLMPSLQ